MLPIPQSIPIAARRRLYFTGVDSTNLQTRQTGLSGFTIRVAKAGVAEAAGANTVTEQDAADMPGIYYYELSVTEANTPGPGVVRISKAGTETREIPFLITPAFFGTAATGTLSATAFTSSRTDATSHWIDALIKFHTGTLEGQVKKVGAYSSVGGLFTLAGLLTFTAAPANGDVFEILTA